MTVTKNMVGGMLIALVLVGMPASDADAAKAIDCIDYLNLSNQFGGRIEFKNRCTKPVAVSFCVAPERGGQIKRSGTIPAGGTRYFDFQSYLGRAKFSVRACATSQNCAQVKCL